jgi:4-hydroxy-2-oxoheptanedioate aldolase
MSAPVNEFKKAILEKRQLIGFWQSLASTTTAEISAYAGFDWLLIDGEHAPNTTQSIIDQLRVVDPSPSQAVVRVVNGEAWQVKQVLDVGAQTVLVPMIDTAEQAQAMVNAIRYAPVGIRGAATVTRAAGYGRTENYFATADEQICLLVQAETKTALENLEEICAVDGVDGVFIGPADLSNSLGHVGAPMHPDVQSEIKAAIKTIARLGKAPGILMSNGALAQEYLELGAQFVAVGTDVSAFANATSNLAAKFKGSKAPSAEPSVY